MSDTDLQLLARYTRQRAEDAFAEIVRRHLGLVYSAALRQVRSPQLAEEVAQSAFTDLARNAHRLAPDTILTAWLYQVACRTAIDVVRRESRRQLREQIASEMNAMNATASDWTHIEPLLDEAMHALDDTDRAAVLLRYFENKSLREVGAMLGTSDDAAQKRVSRAIERLREFFTKRGVTVGAGGLVVVISANAVQAAPAALAVSISTAAVLAGSVVQTSTAAVAAKAMAMTGLQKTILSATFAVLAGAGIYEAYQVSQQRSQIQTLQQQQAPLAEQIRQLQQDRDDATNRLAALREENQRLSRNRAELLRLRGEVGVLRRQADELEQLRARSAQVRQPAPADSSASQSSARQPTVAQILVTHVKQPQAVSEDQIRVILSVKVGDPYDRAAVDRDVRNLYGTGWFRNLRVSDTTTNEGVILNYFVQEKPKLTGISFAGSVRFREADLTRILTSRVDESLDERTLFVDAQNIQALYLKSGFTNAKVNYSLKADEDLGEGNVTFEIKE